MSLRAWRFLIPLAVLALLASSCGSESVAESVAPVPTVAVDVDVEEAATPIPAPTATPLPTPAPTPTMMPEPVSYDGSFASSIQPILEEKCASCHYDGGPGSFHWNLRTAQDVADTHQLVASVIASNAMPPWPASDLSVAFKGDRSLSSDQVQAIVDWVDDGAPVDVASSTSIDPVEPLLQLQNPDLVLAPQVPYAGDPSNPDDLRCLVYDLDLDEDVWVTGYEFVPDQAAVVHHGVGFLMPAGTWEDTQTLDGADGRPGWDCAGSAGLLAGIPLAVWAPGQEPEIYPEGTGRQVGADDFLVMQIHYHYEGDAPLDSSTLALMIEPSDVELEPIQTVAVFAPVEIPCAEWEAGPLCDRDAAYADAAERFGAGGVLADSINARCGVTAADFERFTQGVAQSTCTESALRLGAGAQVQGLFLHMHEIGEWTRLTLNKGMPDEQILVDIPDWDYDWQYTYEPVDPIVLGVLDTLTLECGWNRDRRNPDLEPAWILWAEGTNDEMCIAYVTVR